MYSSTFGTCLFILIWSLWARNSLGSVTPAAIHRRQLPPEANGLKTILSPSGVQIRYKEPGQAGVCETTPGVNSYSGYVDLAPDVHTFFWFFEARNKPAEAPITLWLNGGPGSDSLIGLFQGEPPRAPRALLPNMPLLPSGVIPAASLPVQSPCKPSSNPMSIPALIFSR